MSHSDHQHSRYTRKTRRQTYVSQTHTDHQHARDTWKNGGKSLKFIHVKIYNENKSSKQFLLDISRKHDHRLLGNQHS